MSKCPGFIFICMNCGAEADVDADSVEHLIPDMKKVVESIGWMKTEDDFDICKSCIEMEKDPVN